MISSEFGQFLMSQQNTWSCSGFSLGRSSSLNMLQIFFLVFLNK